MGTGSTLIACIETNRKYLGIEIDNKYYKIAKKRIIEVKKLNEKNKQRKIF